MLRAVVRFEIPPAIGIQGHLFHAGFGQTQRVETADLQLRPVHLCPSFIALKLLILATCGIQCGMNNEHVFFATFDL